MITQGLDFSIDITIDDQKSSSVEIPGWVKTAVIRVPSLDNCTLTVEVIAKGDATLAKLLASNDTDWLQVYNADGYTDVLGLGLDPAWVNISSYLEGLPTGCHMRIATSVAQTANREFEVFFKQ